MKNKLFIVLSLIILFFGLAVRLYKFENRAPFDWDQNRDYKGISEIARGKLTLIGPVAKGEGGFFLGPLYYYLVTPTYLLMSGSPLSLPLTSIFLDVLVIVAILILFHKILGDYSTLTLASFWSASWFLIEQSRISWNVSMLPLWCVLFIYLLSQPKTLNLKSILSLGLITGFSWHVHAALIPLSLAISLLYFRRWGFSFRSIISFLCGYFIPLLPLILFDIRHSGLNFHLISEMFRAGATSSTNFLPLLNSILLRLGKNTQAIFTGAQAYSASIGIIILLLSLIIAIFKRGIYRLSGLIIILNFLAVLALKEPGFPEYYLAASYLPTLILTIGIIKKFSRNRPIFLSLIFLCFLYLNWQNYSLAPTSFGLSQKIGIAESLSSLGSRLDLNFDLPPGREGGIIPLYRRLGGVLDSNSEIKITITDQTTGPLLYDGELMSDLGYFGGIRLAKIVVK